MALTNYTIPLQYAKEHHITIGAFNCFNMESLQACCWAARDKKVPIILQCYFQHLDYCGIPTIANIAHAIAPQVEEGMCIGLDHGRSFDQAKACIDAGFTGVMIDLSSDDLDVNIAQTKRVVEYGHARGVTVEAELGTILGGNATPDQIATGLTDPEAARRFVEATGVDCLAVSVGTAHGPYAYRPQIHFDLLEELIKTVPCPIVVHGGSGTPDEDVARMVKLGISKLNVGTDFFAAFSQATREYYAENGEKGNIFAALAAGRKAVYETACHKLDILTCCRI